MTLRAPFPWFGGKSRVAHLVWDRFGDPANYVEPFAGSLAVLLRRPHQPRIETVNDIDCYLSNFWRALKADPENVARHADWPVNEADLHARHRWLVDRVEFRERMMTDPDYYDAKIAGWWVWGISQWIGGGWCSNPEWRGRTGFGAPRGVHGVHVTRGAGRGAGQRPSLEGNGVHRLGARDRADGTPRRSRPALMPQGVHGRRWGSDQEAPPRKRPSLKRGGSGGVTSRHLGLQIPDLSGDSGAAGRSIHASGLHRKSPKMDRGTSSRPQAPAAALLAWFEDLAARLRYVRVCCGDWRRILGPSPTVHIGVTGVFLDPPYGGAADRDADIYACEDLDVAHEVCEWAILNGDNPRLRIALCGYVGEHAMPPTWSCVAWTSQGGYGLQGQGRGRANRERERIWFSPHCIAPASAGPLFAESPA